MSTEPNTYYSVDMYLDDLERLDRARYHALHAPMAHDAFSRANASYCRILLVFAVGMIESLVKDWHSKSNANNLKVFLEGVSGDPSNTTKVRHLKAELKANGVVPEDRILDSYVRLKQVRNAIIHSRVDVDNALQLAGLPKDFNEFGEEEWTEIKHVFNSVISYLHQGQFSDIPAAIFQVAKAPPLPELEVLRRKILSPMQLTTFAWENVSNCCTFFIFLNKAKKAGEAPAYQHSTLEDAARNAQSSWRAFLDARLQAEGILFQEVVLAYDLLATITRNPDRTKELVENGRALFNTAEGQASEQAPKREVSCLEVIAAVELANRVAQVVPTEAGDLLFNGALPEVLPELAAEFEREAREAWFIRQLLAFRSSLDHFLGQTYARKR